MLTPTLCKKNCKAVAYLGKKHLAQSRWSTKSCWLKNDAQCSQANFAFTLNSTIIPNPPHHLDMTQLQKIDADFNLLALCLNTLEKHNYPCTALAFCVWFLWSPARSAYVISIHLWVNANVPVALKKWTQIHRTQQIFCSISPLFVFIVSETVTALKNAIICQRTG